MLNYSDKKLVKHMYKAGNSIMLIHELTGLKTQDIREYIEDNNFQIHIKSNVTSKGSGKYDSILFEPLNTGKSYAEYRRIDQNSFFNRKHK